MNYSEKLKDPRWQKKRLEVFQRDEFECKLCGSKENTLQVHHLIYFKNRNPWEYDNSLLITLCNNCHEFAKDFDYTGMLIEHLFKYGYDKAFREAIRDLHGTFINIVNSSHDSILENYKEILSIRKFLRKAYKSNKSNG